MPLIQKPVAFDSINFLPGFPSLSRYGCNPWNRFNTAGACPSDPINVSNEPSPGMSASAYISRAMAEAGVSSPVIDRMVRSGVIPASLAGIVGQLGRKRMIVGLRGSGGALIEGLGGGGGGASISDGGDAIGECQCGGRGGCPGAETCGATRLGDLTQLTTDPVGWVTGNAMPLAIGFGLAWFFLKRR